KMRKAELISTINKFLVEQYTAGRKVLLIVDEAQNLTMRVLEEIRLLSGVETTKDKVLRIILAGQPELNDKLDAPELAQLMQRVRLRFHLQTLAEAETKSYIQHRLDVAGAGDREIFAPDTALAAAGAEPGTAVARLLVATEGRTVQEIPLRIGRVIIGRTPDNDVQIDSRFISRHHCQVITTAHSCHIEDLNSTNGIYV